jgi:hypothetical protein
MFEKRLDDKAVSTILQEMVLLLELKGENPFKVKAYSNAARSIEIHVHSFYSDGTSSIKNMARAAKEMGFSYFGLSDHSQRAHYAGGLILEKLKKQWEEVDQLPLYHHSWTPDRSPPPGPGTVSSRHDSFNQ